MDTISLLTVFASLATYHIILGTVLIICLSGWLKLVKHTAEMQNWLWITLFVVATILPITLFLPDETVKIYQQITRQNNSSKNEVKSTANISFIRNKSTNEVNLNSNTEINEQQNFSAIKPNNYYWHIPSQFIFRTSSLLYLLAIIWLIGILWRLKVVIFSILYSRKLLNQTIPFAKRKCH